MKKVLNYILLTAILGTFLPYSALAQTTDVGVNITGSVSIDVVTTISADITLDLTTGETTPTYMEIQNNSSVPVNAKITNISTTSEGAPSTFVDFMEKDWYNLSKEETSTYVNFSILGEGQNVTAQNILPNTEIDLGVLSGNVDIGGFACGEYPCYVPTDPNQKIFEINANFGRNWDEGNKNFTYQIETVYSQADSYVDPALSYTYPDMGELPDIRSMELIGMFTYEDLSDFTFVTSMPEDKHFEYYYLFAFDMNEGMGALGPVESEIALFHQYNRQENTGAYNLFANNVIANGAFQNYVIELDPGYDYYGLIVPSSITNSELNAGTNYKTVDIEMLKPINNGGTTFGMGYFDDYNTVYNYTYIIKLVNN